nr:hypothetical protein BaRGS_012373 [Batillaria attramentaria]
MSFVVLLVHGMNNSTNVLLTGVTVSDFFYLVTMYTRKISCIVGKFDYVLSLKIERGLLPTVYMVNRIFGLTTPFLTMLITLERCLAVSIPFKVSEIVTPLRMKIAVTVVYVFSAIAIIPFFFIYEVQYYPNRSGEMIPVPVGTKFFYDNFDVISAYNNIALSGVFYFGPMAIVLVCTVFIFITIKKSSRWRQATAKGGERPEERRMTRLLMTVVICYLGAYIPGGAIGIANQVNPDFGSIGGRYNNLFQLVAGLQLLLYAVRSSVNFIIYMLMSKKFFNTYRRIFLCKKGEDGKQTTKTGISKQKSVTTKTELTSKGEESTAGSSTCEAAN